MWTFVKAFVISHTGSVCLDIRVGRRYVGQCKVLSRFGMDNCLMLLLIRRHV